MAFGPGLWATEDGGASWHQVAVDVFVVSLETAGGVVYAIGSAVPGRHVLRRGAAAGAVLLGGEFRTVVVGPTGSLTTTAAQDSSLQPPAGFALLGESGAGATVYASDDLAAGSWNRFPDPCAGTHLSLSSFVAPNASALYSLCSGTAPSAAPRRYP